MYLLLERGPIVPADALVEVPGVAGVWSYDGSSSLHPRLTETAGVHLTICYLDDDPATTAGRLAATLVERWASGAIVPMLAAPFVTVVPWAWDAALPV